MHEPGHRRAQRKKLHQCWQNWVVIGLMPVAMGNYVLTLDDSMEPDGPSGKVIPAQSITALNWIRPERLPSLMWLGLPASTEAINAAVSH